MGIRYFLLLGPVYIDTMSAKIENSFWISVLKSIKSILSTIQPISVGNIKGIPLWCSDNLNIEMKAVWLRAGISLVGDVLDDIMLPLPKEAIFEY